MSEQVAQSEAIDFNEPGSKSSEQSEAAPRELTLVSSVILYSIVASADNTQVKVWSCRYGGSIELLCDRWLRQCFRGVPRILPCNLAPRQVKLPDLLDRILL